MGDEGDLVVKGAQLGLGDGCLECGAVRADQAVKTGSRCQVTRVLAQGIERGMRSRAEYLSATADASLHDGVSLAACRVKGRLTLHGGIEYGIEIREGTLTAGGIEWPEAAQLKLDGVAVDRSHLFLRQHGKLLPGPESGAVVEQSVVVTTLLNADLARAIQECSTVTLRLPSVGV